MCTTHVLSVRKYSGAMLFVYVCVCVCAKSRENVFFFCFLFYNAIWILWKCKHILHSTCQRKTFNRTPCASSSISMMAQCALQLARTLTRKKRHRNPRHSKKTPLFHRAPWIERFISRYSITNYFLSLSRRSSRRCTLIQKQQQQLTHTHTRFHFVVVVIAVALIVSPIFQCFSHQLKRRRKKTHNTTLHSTAPYNIGCCCTVQLFFTV